MIGYINELLNNIPILLNVLLEESPFERPVWGEHNENERLACFYSVMIFSLLCSGLLICKGYDGNLIGAVIVSGMAAGAGLFTYGLAVAFVVDGLTKWIKGWINPTLQFVLYVMFGAFADFLINSSSDSGVFAPYSMIVSSIFAVVYIALQARMGKFRFH